MTETYDCLSLLSLIFVVATTIAAMVVTITNPVISSSVDFSALVLSSRPAVAAIAAVIGSVVMWIALKLGKRAEEPRKPQEAFSDVNIPTWSNRPRPQNFFVSMSRGERIYFELHGVAPSDLRCRALIFLNTGVTAHMMRPTYVPLLTALGEAGFAVATFDWSGHGYSEGDRCTVKPMLMLQDYEQFIDLILNSIDTLELTEGAIRPVSIKGCSSPRVSSRLRAKSSGGAEKSPSTSLPWFVCGQSMSGGLTCLFAQRVWTEILGNDLNDAGRKGNNVEKGPKLQRTYSNFGGWIGVAPFMKPLDRPPAPIYMMMRFVAWLFPMHLIPKALLGAGMPDECCWPSRELIAWHMTHDLWGVPGGLGWGKPIRWGSAAGFFDLSDALSERCLGMGQQTSISFPILICHDPNDKITSFEGSLLLFDRARTDQKQICRMEGGLHDLFCNRGSFLVEQISSWVTELQ